MPRRRWRPISAFAPIPCLPSTHFRAAPPPLVCKLANQSSAEPPIWPDSPPTDEILGHSKALEQLHDTVRSEWRGVLILHGPRGVGRRRVASWVAAQWSRAPSSPSETTTWITTSPDTPESELPVDPKTRTQAKDEAELMSRLDDAIRHRRDDKRTFILDLGDLSEAALSLRALPLLEQTVLEDRPTASWIAIAEKTHIEPFPRRVRRSPHARFVPLRALDNTTVRAILTDHFSTTPPSALGLADPDTTLDAAVALAQGSPGEGLAKAKVLAENMPPRNPSLLADILDVPWTRARTAAAAAGTPRSVARAQTVVDVLRWSEALARVEERAFHAYALELLGAMFWERARKEIDVVIEEGRAMKEGRRMLEDAFGRNLSLAQAHEAVTAGVELGMVWDVLLLRVAGFLPASPRKLKHGSAFKF